MMRIESAGHQAGIAMRDVGQFGKGHGQLQLLYE
jgi:hypothetical protein